MDNKNVPLMTAAFEGSLIAVAIGLGWLLDSPPLTTFSFRLRDVALGIVGTLPPLGLFWLCINCPLKPLQRIKEILDAMVLPLFHDCRLEQLAILAALAGLGEEMLFRGVLQAAAAAEIGGAQGAWLGLLIAAVLFGLLHFITPTYAFLAGLIGLYLGAIWLACGNLLTPILIHGFYDFAVLGYLLKFRGSPPSASSTPPQHDT
jgi:membrane protease YdiL (CAAX protease family)